MRNSPLLAFDPNGMVTLTLPMGGSDSILDEINMMLMQSEAGLMSEGAYGVSGGAGCTADGVDSPCAVVGALVQSGGAIQCPNNNCTQDSFTTVTLNGKQVASYGQVWNYQAFSGGTSSYYAAAGPGSLYTSEDQAGAAAGQYFLPFGQNTAREFGGWVTEDPSTGFYSYDLGGVGDSCTPTTPTCAVQFEVPLPSDGVASWHIHPNEIDSSDQFDPDRMHGNYPYPAYITTLVDGSSSTFLISGPEAIPPIGVISLTLQPICQVSGVSSFPDVGACH